MGINYTTFFSEKVGSDLKGLGYTSLSLDDSIGLAFSAGLDYAIDANWGVNISAMYADISTEATLKGGALGRLTVDYDIDPMVYRFNVVYKF